MGNEMQAGRELDRAIAERVMGWKLGPFSRRSPYRYWVTDGKPVVETRDWMPSEDIGDAWQVVEKLQDFGASVAIGTHPECEEEGWACMFGLNGMEANAIAPTAPLAICLAALAALESEVAR